MAAVSAPQPGSVASPEPLHAESVEVPRVKVPNLNHVADLLESSSYTVLQAVHVYKEGTIARSEAQQQHFLHQTPPPGGWQLNEEGDSKDLRTLCIVCRPNKSAEMLKLKPTVINRGNATACAKLKITRRWLVAAVSNLEQNARDPYMYTVYFGQRCKGFTFRCISAQSGFSFFQTLLQLSFFQTLLQLSGKTLAAMSRFNATSEPRAREAEAEEGRRSSSSRTNSTSEAGQTTTGTDDGFSGRGDGERSGPELEGGGGGVGTASNGETLGYESTTAIARTGSNPVVATNPPSGTGTPRAHERIQRSASASMASAALAVDSPNCTTTAAAASGNNNNNNTMSPALLERLAVAVNRKALLMEKILSKLVARASGGGQDRSQRVSNSCSSGGLTEIETMTRQKFDVLLETCTTSRDRLGLAISDYVASAGDSADVSNFVTQLLASYDRMSAAVESLGKQRQHLANDVDAASREAADANAAADTIEASGAAAQGGAPARPPAHEAAIENPPLITTTPELSDAPCTSLPPVVNAVTYANDRLLEDIFANLDSPSDAGDRRDANSFPEEGSGSNGAGPSTAALLRKASPLRRNISEPRSSGSDALVPSTFLCPITLEVFKDPVLASDGFSYERVAIEDWLTRSTSSPMTGEEFDATTLIPNHVLRNALEEWVEHSKKVRASGERNRSKFMVL